MNTSAPLDVMFGPGTAEGFATRVDISSIIAGATAAITETLTGNGSVYTQVLWSTEEGLPIGRYDLEWLPTRIHCALLEVEPPYREAGINTHLMIELAEWWPTLGVEVHTMTCEPGSAAEKALLLCGYETLPDGSFGAQLTGEGRGYEYIAYMVALNQWEQEEKLKIKHRGLAPQQPAWRAELEAEQPEEPPF